MLGYPEGIEVRVAERFAQLLRAHLGAEDFTRMQNLNAEEAEPGVCHSHDFCDANVFMADAIEEAIGREADPDTDTDLWNRAWDIAAREHLR